MPFHRVMSRKKAQKTASFPRINLPQILQFRGKANRGDRGPLLKKFGAGRTTGIPGGGEQRLDYIIERN
jgi:hypothetical protein